MSRVRTKPVCALLAVAALGILVTPTAFAGAEHTRQAKGATGVKKQFKRLKSRIATLEQRLEQVAKERGPQGPEGSQGPAGPPGPATGPAGGDLTGTFPAPLIAADAVGSPEISSAAVGAEELAANAVDGANVADDTIFKSDIGPDGVGRSEIETGGVGAFELADTIAVVGEGKTVTAGTPRETAVSCPASHRRLIAGGYAWSKEEPNSIIYSVPHQDIPYNIWLVRGMPDSGSNTLFAWATCLAV